MHPGEEIFLKLTKSPDVRSEDYLSQLPFVVKILWRKRLRSSSYKFGYGAQYLDPGDVLVKNNGTANAEETLLAISQTQDDEDPRAYPRRTFNKPLVLDYKNQCYRSLVTDISHGGAFIKTRLRIPLGKKVVIVIPGSKIRKESKINGWIVRRNPEGFAVKFDRSSGRDPRSRSDRRTASDRRAAFDRRTASERRIASERRTGSGRRTDEQQERRGNHEN